MISFLKDLIAAKYNHERDWLKTLREASEDWYNQLTEPLMPVLLGQIDSNDPQIKEKYQRIADDLLREAFIVNAGDEVRNIFQEMGNRGLPFITSRKALQPLLVEYLKGGLFLKRLAFGFEPERAIAQWQKFGRARDELRNEINSQLEKLG